MLKTKDLINKLGIEYEEMVKKVNIPDFTKCIAQYSGIDMQYLKDEVIEDYLCTWAKSKKYIFDLMGAIKVDMPIHYANETINSENDIKNLAKTYIPYYHWLEMFANVRNNKILSNYIGWSGRSTMSEVFPDLNYDGMSLTRFFKSQLNAPDELVTALGRIWENQEVDATFTLSIDPVDIMLSSENPYNWTSCYRLENIDTSHADGCLAGVLDSATIITYIWDKEGKLNLYHKYDLKCVRYKRIRMTIAVNKDFTAIHFNTPYPGCSNYSDNFKKILREKVETYFSNKLDRHNVWIKNNDIMYRVEREHEEYGYSEYSDGKVYLLKGEESYEPFHIYDNPIYCPCGCGEKFFGTYEDDDFEYNGEGLINENFAEYNRGYYCEYEDEYVDCSGDCGPDCANWCRNNAVCSLDENESCDRNVWDAEDDGDFDPYEGNVVSCNPEHCADCPLYKLHHPGEFEEIEEQPTNETVSLVVAPNTITNSNIVWRAINSSTSIINSTDNIKKDLAFYKILSGEDFTEEDFRLVLEEQHEDPVLPNMTEYKLSNSGGDRHISVSVPNDVIGTEEFINVIKPQIHN